MAKNGKDFNKLVATIEKVVASNQHLTIEENAFLDDKRAGNKREHDILLRYNDAHREFLISIECKDWERRVDQPVVEAFITKLRNTGVQKGILVSSSGFSSNALATAKDADINCWSLKEAEEFDWIIAKGVTQYRQKITNTHITAYPVISTKEKVRLFLKSEHGGQEIDNLADFAVRILSSVEIPAAKDGEVATITVEVEDYDSFVVITESGCRLDLRRIVVIADYYTVKTFSPFALHTYQDDATKKAKNEIARANISLWQGMTGDIIVTKDGSVSLIVDKPKII